MKILLSAFGREITPTSVFIDHLYKWFGKQLVAEKCDFRFLLNEENFVWNLENHSLDRLSPVVLTKKERHFITQSVYNAEAYYGINGLNDAEENRLKNVIHNKLGDWIPDIIMSQGIASCRKIWQNIYPKALCLTQENAIFSRPPYPRTLCYDPIGINKGSFLTAFSEDIKSVSIDENQRKNVENFKKQLVTLLESNSTVSEQIIKETKKFRKTVLLPLTGNFLPYYVGESKYRNSFDLLEYVLKNVPRDVGVFVTEADQGGILDDENYAYFHQKYPNFIFMKKANIKGFNAASLHFLPYVDAVINEYSKTGITALLYDKPVISLADPSNDLIKDGNIEDLEKVLSAPVRNKDNILYWCFTHYVVFQKDFEKENFLRNFLKTKLEKFRDHGIGFDFYEQINDFDDVTNYVLDCVKNYYAPKVEPPKQNIVPDRNVNRKIAKLENTIQELEKLLKRPSFLEYQRVRFLSHITFGQTKQHYVEKKKKYKTCV